MYLGYIKCYKNGLKHNYNIKYHFHHRITVHKVHNLTVHKKGSDGVKRSFKD